MNSFFRWATILIALGIIVAGATTYFWLRAQRDANPTPLVSTADATATDATALDTPDSEADPRVTTPEPAPDIATPTDATSTEAGTEMATEAAAPRQAVVILPPGESRSAAEDDSSDAVSNPAAPVPNAAGTLSSTLSSGTESTDTTIDATALFTAPTNSPEPPILPSATATPLAPILAVAAITSTNDASWLRPADVQVPQSLAFGIATPTVRAQIVVPAVVTALAGSAGIPTPTPITITQPIAIQLYDAPDLNAVRPGATGLRASMDIVARDTTGTWYLLLDGLWVRAEQVSDPPPQLPLVVPTVTPTPTNTGEPTPSPVPDATEIPPPTATPTATPLDFPVCDCSPNTYACVTHSFRVRAQAQACFEYCFRITGQDIHNLDPDVNGMACESLPD
ncbi:MAG: hypothetical protein WDZ49_11400 [Litorilinea sp.]